MLSTLLLLATTAAPVQAGEFVDTWVTLAFEDDSVLAGPEFDSPAANFVARGNRTFFEDYETRYSDDISQSHLALYRQDEGFWKDWYTEAAFVVQFTPYLNPDESDEGLELQDDGSYVRLVRRLQGADDKNLSITGYAIDASRFRLGYSYDLSWGGKEIFIKDPGASPGVRMQLQWGGSYAFVGAKTSIQDQEQVDSEDGGTRNQAFYGILAGGGLQLAERFKVEGGVGSFQQGQITTSSETASALFGEPIKALGLAGQLAWRSTPELRFIESAELSLYRNGPDFVKDSYISHDQLDGFGMLAQVEWNYLTHNLIDADQENSTILESAMAGDLQSKFVFGSTSIGLDFVYKDLAYILFNVPGITSCYSISDKIETSPQLYGRVKASHYLEDARTAPYLGMGLMQPATYTNTLGNTYVQYDEQTIVAVPDEQDPVNILGGLAGVEVDASKSVVLVAELLYEVNNNLSDAYTDPSTGEVSRVPVDKRESQKLGFNLMMRARF